MSASNLTDDERCQWLRLIRTENVGPIAFGQLLSRYGSAAAALAAIPDLARRAGKRSIRVATLAEAQAEIAALAKLDGQFVAKGEPDYPPLLAEIEDAPPLLALRGFAHVWKRPCIAIVGARNASLNGQRFARDLAQTLGEAGLTVVSGLARGIDTSAHAGALATGTVAVMAGGIDHIYPAENKELYGRIAAQGAVVSEIRFGEVPQARHFPRRNRIVSGMCRGTLVVEAALRSGSLITARLAGDQGREVFAVPGSPLDPRARGANELLRQGATLVETAQDVLDVFSRLHLESPKFSPEKPPASNYKITEKEISDARDSIYQALAPSPTLVDEIVRECQLSAPVVLAALLELELAGLVDRHPGGRVSRRV
ncbi:MAG: DNA-processing protein DprA [Magnetospirillum sp.]|jgi:DNA processing protein|nr:DNA-processing protein DprA [Magnetospirillum sp.]